VCPVNTSVEAVEDPQAIANGYITEFDHPQWGKLKVPGCPVKFSETPAVPRSKAPEFGEHTEELLIERFGFGWEELAGLREREVI
jgi:crotonobetainyl-CoA:carnitine CoA-transferase CaiB-like acyl-CoA transferase